MLIRQGFQYAVRLKAKDQALVRRWVGCRRFVYNEALAFQNDEIAAGRARPNYEALCKRLPEPRKDHPWLCEPPAQGLQQALKDLCRAWERRYTSGFGVPKFRRKGQGDTIRFPQDCQYDAHRGVICIPKLGKVRLRHSRLALGKLKNVTLRWDGKRFIVSLQTEREMEVAPSAATGEVGLDFGAKVSIMPSEGKPIRLPERVSRFERRLKRLQQVVSRKRRGSNNRRKAVARVAQCHRRIAAMRRDFLHQKTTELVRNNALIAIEDLRIKIMTASAAGTIENPGKHVKAKSGLNRTILRNGWGMARSMLQYKALWHGSTLVAVGPAFTSQTCSCCGHVAAGNRPSQALFECLECGHVENADRNAARNILRRGKQILAGRCPSSTAGYAGTDACSGGASRSRPRSAAQGSAVRPPLAGTIPELSPSGNLHA